MCTGELVGPASKLSKRLATSPLLQNTDPWDILNTLRPLTAKASVNDVPGVQLAINSIWLGGSSSTAGRWLSSFVLYYLR